MKRSILVASVVGLALVLGGCTSTLDVGAMVTPWYVAPPCPGWPVCRSTQSPAPVFCTSQPNDWRTEPNCGEGDKG